LSEARASLDADARSRYAVERQEAIYSGATGLIWRKAVYERLHRGWELANLGGLPFLDSIVDAAHLGPESRVLELGSGAGAACQYLVRLCGCRATGVERNRAQIDRAIARSAQSAERDRLDFIAGDLTSWRSGEKFDVAFMLDTVSLLPDPGAALRTVASALRGGRVFIADTGAGPRISSRQLERAFTEDGFCSLLGVDETEALLSQGGFADIDFQDHTDQACDALRSIIEWLDDPPASLRAELPPGLVSDWRDVNSFYLDAYETGAFSYRWWSARRITAQKRP
jgi:SAM-dependent methyltransferase